MHENLGMLLWENKCAPKRGKIMRNFSVTLIFWYIVNCSPKTNFFAFTGCGSRWDSFNFHVVYYYAMRSTHWKQIREIFKLIRQSYPVFSNLLLFSRIHIPFCLIFFVNYVLWFHLMNISSAAAQLDIKSLALDHPRPIMVIIKQQLTWKKKNI